MEKREYQWAWLMVLPVVLVVAFSAIIPLMTVVNYSLQDIFGPDSRFFVGTEWFVQTLRDPGLRDALGRQVPVLWRDPGNSDSAGYCARPVHAA